MFLAGKPRNSKQPKGMCTLKISPHSFIAVTLVKNSFTHGRRTGPFFSKFYTVRYSQRWFYYHLKTFKKYEFSQNLEIVAQKLCPPRPFQF